MPTGKIKNFTAIGRKLNIPDFALLPVNWDLSWIDGVTGGGGGGGAPPVVDIFTGLLNGVRTSFTLASAPATADTVLVVFNGLVMARGNASGYTLSGTALVTNFIGSVGDTLVVYTFTA